MNITEQEHENCTDTVYDIVENGLNINTQNIYFHAVHRVGKPRSPEDSHHHPRPIIARFLCREDRDRVLKAKGILRHSKDYTNAYITKDYTKAIQLERKELIKAMFIARKKDMSAKVVDRNLVINRKKLEYSFFKKSTAPKKKNDCGHQNGTSQLFLVVFLGQVQGYASCLTTIFNSKSRNNFLIQMDNLF